MSVGRRRRKGEGGKRRKHEILEYQNIVGRWAEEEMEGAL